MEKKGKSSRRQWLFGGPWILFLLLGGFLLFWMNREPTTLTLKYGELIEVLTAARNNPAVTFPKFKVDHNDIRGEIVCTDPVSMSPQAGAPADGKENGKHTQTVSFRTLRLGLENDVKLHDLLKETVGPAYQGEEEESPLRNVLSFLLTSILLLGLGLGALVLMMRWMSGGGSPLSFGRSRVWPTC